MKYKNYIFDLYGTLADIATDENSPMLWEKMSAVYSMNGAAYTPDEFRDAYGRLVSAEIEKTYEALPKNMRPEVTSLAEPELLNVFKNLFEEKGITKNLDELKQIAIFFRATSLQKELKLFDGVEETLKTLKENGKKVYLLSNAQSCFTVPEFNSLGIGKYFDDTIISSNVHVKKPSKQIFECLIKKHNLKISECVMTGNDINADIAGAESVGMNSYYIHTWQSSMHPKSFPEHCREIFSIPELLQY